MSLWMSKWGQSSNSAKNPSRNIQLDTFERHTNRARFDTQYPETDVRPRVARSKLTPVSINSKKLRERLPDEPSTPQLHDRHSSEIFPPPRDAPPVFPITPQPSAAQNTIRGVSQSLTQVPGLSLKKLGPGTPELTDGERRKISAALRIISGADGNIPPAQVIELHQHVWSPKKRKLSQTATGKLPAKKIFKIADGIISAPFKPTYRLYEKHPEEDRTDEWFEHEFKSLYDNVVEFVVSHFGYMDIDNTGPYESLWNDKLTPEFLKYTQTIAEPDYSCGGWDEILCKRDQRSWLLIGIIARAFERAIFQPLLFGADDWENTLLENMEVGLVDKEGFTRTSLRAKTTRAILGTRTVATEFYLSTTIVAQQIVLLLEPLATHIRVVTNALAPRRCPSANQLLQSMIDLVGQAAYLSICVRMSPNIMQIYSETPGSAFDPKTQQSVDAEAYARSKTAVTAELEEGHRFQKFGMNNAATFNTALYQGINKTPPAANRVAIDTQAIGALNSEGFERGMQPVPQDPPFRARTKIVVWPKINSFRQGSGQEGGEKDGMTEYMICKARVVCYWALDDRTLRKQETVRDVVQRHTPSWVSRAVKEAKDVVPFLGGVAVTAVAYQFGAVGGLKDFVFSFVA